jgi:cellulose biosynthesis protein BcsQ
MMKTTAEGRIITFYSYKGGIGRSMALANVAWILAANGLRVLAIDWDLESPGLLTFFRPFLQDPTGASTRGVIDLLHDHALWAANANVEDAQELEILPYLQSVQWSFPDPGYLDVMSAGRFDPVYPVRLATFDWEAFYRKLGGAGFLDRLRAHLRAEYDYVLIDSRTGLSDAGAVSTIALPDTLVVGFPLNSHIMEGCAATARSIVEQRSSDPLRIVPVPMRVERGEKELLERGFAQAERLFNPLMSGTPPENRRRYWQEIAFFYTPYYAFSPYLAAFGDAHLQSDSILASALRLASHLADRPLEAGPPVSEEQRREVLAHYDAPDSTRSLPP